MKRLLWIYVLISVGEAQAGFRPQVETGEGYGPPAPVRLVQPKPVVQPQSAHPAAPPVYEIKGWKREELWKFSRNARKLSLPRREYGTQVRAKEILARYEAALNPSPHLRIRTAYRLVLAPTQKVPEASSLLSFEIWTARLDALFQILWREYPSAVTALWRLSENPQNPKTLQARDALFAAEGAMRAGWHRTGAMALHRAVDRKISEEERYAETLWRNIARINDDEEATLLLKRLPTVAVDSIPFKSDRIYYLLGHREKIGDTELAARMDLAKALRFLERKQWSESKMRLEEIASLAAGETRNSALVNIARIHLQEGNPQEALLYYSNVKRDGKNRLDVLLETAFAEYRSGDYSGSLGKAVALQSPYFQFGFAPDAYLMEILSRKALCDFGGAENALQRFFIAYEEELRELRSLGEMRLKRGELYKKLIASYHSPEPKRYERYLLHLPAVARRQAFIHSVRQEAKTMAAIGTQKYDVPIPERWLDFVATMETFHRPKIASRVEQIEVYARKEMQSIVTRLLRAFAAADLIRLDIATNATKDFAAQSALNFPVAELKRNPELKNKILWPYESEVWEDELDHLRIKGDGKCASRTLASAPAELADAEAAADRQ